MRTARLRTGVASRWGRVKLLAAIEALAGRVDSHRHQAARPLRAPGPSHHRQPHPPAEVGPRHRAGSTHASPSTITPGWAARRSSRTRPDPPCIAFLFNALRFIRPTRTRLHTLRTDGKAERFVLTSFREWVSARAGHASEQRRADLPSAPTGGARTGPSTATQPSDASTSPRTRC